MTMLAALAQRRHERPASLMISYFCAAFTFATYLAGSLLKSFVQDLQHR